MSMSGVSAAPQQTGLTAAQTAQQQAANAIAVNNQIRSLWTGPGAVAIPVKQSIYSSTIVNPGTSNNVLRVLFQPVGLVKGFIVKMTVAFQNTGSGAASLTAWNLANLLSNVTLYDFDNYQRINTTGIHLNMIGTDKEGFPYASALKSSAFDTPIEYGSNFGVLSASATIPAEASSVPGTGSAEFYFYVPCAYSHSDLRGAIWAGVVGATAYLQLTINPTPGVASGDPTFAVYSGANSAVTITSATVQVYQDYFDQGPKYPAGSPNAGAPILPPLDIATQYRLNSTSLTGLTSNQQFPVPFTNFQQFLSLGLIYDQNGTLNPGTDISNFSLTAANTYTQFSLDPITQALLQRYKIKTDYPNGSYLFGFRGAPITTNQTGNQQLLLTPSGSVASGSSVQAMFESFALTSNVLGAASLPAS